MNTTKTFTLLSIGYRGVGKTVFLAGSYAELLSDTQKDSLQQLSLKCHDIRAQKNIDKILNYVVQNSEYPPATMKVKNFNFSLKLLRYGQKKTKTLSYFRWRDIPGEICSLSNVKFERMALSSHGCCVFIDAYALVYDKAYIQVLEDIIKQVMAIALLYGSKYPFALILTKCDLLPPGRLSRQQLELGLQPLTIRLHAIRANYQTFYSHIPIVRTERGSTLSPKGAAAPLLWLVWELSLAQNRSLMNNLLGSVTPLLPRCFQPRQAMVERALQDLIEPYGNAVRAKTVLSLHLKLASYKYILLLVLVVLSLLGAICTFLMIALLT